MREAIWENEPPARRHDRSNCQLSGEEQPPASSGDNYSLFKSGEGIRQGPPHVGLDLSENLTEQRKPPLALEALEEGGLEDLAVVAIREILKRIPAALK